MMRCDVAVIGAGPAGMMAAISAADAGARVVLIEKNTKPGRKLMITGKGRCNITNDCDRETFLANIPRNPKFLFSAISRFSPADTITFFENHGVPLKTERGDRVFPVSDRASDINDALVRSCKTAGVRIIAGRAERIGVSDGRIGYVQTQSEKIECKALILATGGLSYPLTGSTGDGYRLAQELGHTVTELRPSLVPLVAEGECCAACQGLSLRNVGFKLCNDVVHEVYSDFGELLFTHFGLSGPMALSASAHIGSFENKKWFVLIDLKPALDEKTLDERLLRDFKENVNRDLINALDALLPQKLIAPLVVYTGLDPRIKVHSVTKPMRDKLLSALKAFRVELSGFRPIEEAIVTSGGVHVNEINAKDMQSKLVNGLFFAGEVIDVDGYTGGFNLQIALSTGFLAGSMAGRYCDER